MLPSRFSISISRSTRSHSPTCTHIHTWLSPSFLSLLLLVSIISIHYTVCRIAYSPHSLFVFCVFFLSLNARQSYSSKICIIVITRNPNLGPRGGYDKMAVPRATAEMLAALARTMRDTLPPAQVLCAPEMSEALVTATACPCRQLLVDQNFWLLGRLAKEGLTGMPCESLPV